MKKVKNTPTTSRKLPPAKTPNEQENRMISLANDLAEKQLKDGTASSQIITHFVKEGSPKARLEREILEKEKELITAKTDSIKSQKRVEELYLEAMKAMKIYSGDPPDEEDEYDGDD